MFDFITAPECLRGLVEKYRWIPAAGGESGARVYRLEQAITGPVLPLLYLKWGVGPVANEVTAEMVRLRWLAELLPVPQIQHFCRSEDQAWLLTSALPGRSADECLESDPDDRLQIARALGEFLSKLHALPVAECPFNSDHELRMVDARRRMESGEVDAGDFQANHAGWKARDVWTKMQALLPMSFDRVVTHGDFSLGNVLVQNGVVTGCIDVGRSGVADRYQDLAILWSNLEEFGGEMQSAMFEAYGIEAPDARKIDYHLCLDEFF